MGAMSGNFVSSEVGNFFRDTPISIFNCGILGYIVTSLFTLL